MHKVGMVSISELPTELAVSLHQEKSIELAMLKRMVPVILEKRDKIWNRIAEMNKDRNANGMYIEELRARAVELGTVHNAVEREVREKETTVDALRLFVEIAQEMENGGELTADEKE